MTVVGLLHPGEMGTAVAAALRGSGETVLWASAGRSSATAERAERAGLEDAGDVAELCRRCEILLSVCPPHAAADVAREAGGFAGIYVDANAIAPETARTIAALHERFVDGGIVGPPPSQAGTTRLYLSGGAAAADRGPVHRDEPRRAGRLRGARRGFGAEGCVRGLDEGQRGATADRA